MPSASEQPLSPEVKWAQRKELVYINIVIDDCSDPTIKIDKNSLYFKGKGGPAKKDHEVTFNLFDEINPDESKYQVRGRGVEFVLIKARQDQPFWKRLLKDEKKYHWLKIDFGKWKDEDEDSEPEEGGPPGGMPGMGGMGGGAGGTDFEEMMRQMGGLGGMGGMGGMPGMGGGPGGMPDFGDLDDGEGDSDDEDLPDLDAAEKPADGSGSSAVGGDSAAKEAEVSK